MRFVLSMLFLPLLPAAAQECLPLGELVVVQGTVGLGPGGRTGQEKTYILMLDKAACVTGQSKKVRELQLMIRSEHINKSVPHMLRDKLLIRGKLFEATSSRAATSVIIEVESLIKAP
jgi:hypothetical protein